MAAGDVKRRRGKRRPTPRDPDEWSEPAEESFFGTGEISTADVRGLELATASGMYATRRALF